MSGIRDVRCAADHHRLQGFGSINDVVDRHRIEVQHRRRVVHGDCTVNCAFITRAVGGCHHDVLRAFRYRLQISRTDVNRPDTGRIDSRRMIHTADIHDDGLTCARHAGGTGEGLFGARFQLIEEGIAKRRFDGRHRDVLRRELNIDRRQRGGVARGIGQLNRQRIAAVSRTVQRIGRNGGAPAPVRLYLCSISLSVEGQGHGLPGFRCIRVSAQGDRRARFGGVDHVVCRDRIKRQRRRCEIDIHRTGNGALVTCGVGDVNHHRRRAFRYAR